MVRHSPRGGVPAGNPVANVLVIIVGALTIAVSVILGFFAFVALGAIVLVAAAVIGLRVWWLNYRLRRQGGRNGGAGPRRNEPPPGVIEGEYRVIRRDHEEA